MVRSPRLRARALVAASVWATVTATGCATHSGDWSRKAAPQRPSGSADDSSPSAPGLRLFLIGDAGAAGRRGAAVAERLSARRDESEAAGVPSVLVWLGDNGTRERCHKGKANAESQRARPFADLANAHRREHGRASLSTVGELDWRCGVAERIAAGQGQPPPGSTELADAWPQPALNYVVRLDAQGVGTVVSSCTGVAPICTIAADAGGGVAELVVLDTAAWLGSTPPQRVAADRSVAEQRALLAVLRENPPTGGLQRILVSHHPIESAGPHGQGGLYPDSALLFHDEPLQEAILRGDFVGALSGHERSLQVSADITPAVQRSSRLWPERPFFQVVSGSAGRGDAGVRPRAWPFYQSIALAPDNVSNYPGFAELTITDDTFVVVLHARRLGRWETAKTVIPRRPVPPPVERTMPGLEPCLGCDTRDPREQAIDPRP